MIPPLEPSALDQDTGCARRIGRREGVGRRKTCTLDAPCSASRPWLGFFRERKKAETRRGVESPPALCPSRVIRASLWFRSLESVDCRLNASSTWLSGSVLPRRCNSNKNNDLTNTLRARSQAGRR